MKQVRNREVRFMPDRRDDWNCRTPNCAGHFLCIERPQILGRTATTPYNQNIHAILIAILA
jgi:hypothetical protein